MSNPSIDEAENPSDPEYRIKYRHEFGRRLLTTLIDDRARRNHPRPFASISRSADPKDGYRDISYRLFAKAIDRCAWWMKDKLSTSKDFEPVIYVGAFDLRYQILANAAVKTGYVMFFISPRNSLDAQLSLVDDAKVTKILTSSESAIDSMVKPILERRQLQRFLVPELEELLHPDGEVTPFQFSASFDEYRMKPWIMLHTSGSTSAPKIVTIKHGYPTSFDAVWLSPNKSDLISTLGSRRMFIPFPPFHMAGIIVNLACSMFVDATIILPPAAAPLTAEIVNDICIHAKVEVANLPPFILMDMVKNPVYLESLRGLKDLAYGGGPLAQETGDEIIKFVGITSFFGSTEACIVPSLVRPREFWKYFKFDLDFAGIEMRLVENTTNLYELIYIRDPDLGLFQAIFITFPDINEYHSKDLFTKHPTEPDLWRYEGRLDDIIVLSNAEKLNPVAMEGTISSCPLVKGALVVGTGRFQTALLVEVENPPQSGQSRGKEKLLNSVWAYVETANQQCPAYGRINRELITFTQAKKPFIRAAKGTIQRTPTLQLYSKEIDDMYANADNVQNQSTQPDVKDFESVHDTEDFLQRWIVENTRLGKVSPEQDFFNSGMDSLDVVNLTRLIRSTGQAVSTKQVYDHPNIKQLAMSLKSIGDGYDNEGDGNKKRLTEMQQMSHDFRFDTTKQTQAASDTADEIATTSKHVILIGSTGTLGPYLLNGLLADPNVERVTCLNRSTDAQSRQKSKHSALDLITDFQKVTFLKSSLTESNLGLEESDYNSISQSVTHIIYNAWTVDFNQHVSSFKPLLQGIKNVLGFTYGCMPRQVRLFFMSSVSVADRQRVERPDEQVAEGLVNDWSLAKMGYGQSKLVAESLIADAVTRYGINAAICRLCQLGGPVVQRKGEWNRVEWIPGLITSSKVMGIVPESLGPMDMVDWLPIDLVANICLELLFHDSSSSTQDIHTNHQNGTYNSVRDGITSTEQQVRVWHVVNPNPTLWSDLLPSIMAFMPSTVKPVEFVQWVEELERGGDSTGPIKSSWNVDSVPSLKLMSVWRELRQQAERHPRALPIPAFDTKKTVACSETLAQVPAVNSTWTELWMKQWER